MKSFILFLLISAFSMLANANNSEKQIVYEKVKQYANLVSCYNSFNANLDLGTEVKTGLSDVFLVEKEPEHIEYYVFWEGDMGCSGGNGSVSSFITNIWKNPKSHKDFYIIGNDAFGADLDLNYRFIEKIYQISKDEFKIISWDYADEKYGGIDGGQNFPANKFEYTLKLQKRIGWQVTKKRLLEQSLDQSLE